MAAVSIDDNDIQRCEPQVNVQVRPVITYSATGMLGPWFFAIAVREIARHHRAEQARYRSLLRSVQDQGEENLADRVADAASARTWRRPLVEALTRLSRRERDVLLMVAWADLTYEEVARALEIPLGTVRSRLHRFRQEIRKNLPDDIALELT